MLCLTSLPYEVLSNIVGNINFDDIFNLALTCKHFKYLLTEESICKLIVQVSHLDGISRYSQTQAADTDCRQKWDIPMKPWPR
jgi:hypothetical protein